MIDSTTRAATLSIKIDAYDEATITLSHDETATRALLERLRGPGGALQLQDYGDDWVLGYLWTREWGMICVVVGRLNLESEAAELWGIQVGIRVHRVSLDYTQPLTTLDTDTQLAAAWAMRHMLAA